MGILRLGSLSTSKNGQHPKNQENLLQGNKMPQTHPSQGDPVQSCQEANIRQGSETLRTETVGIWWADSSYSSQEGENNKKNCSEDGVFGMQVPQTSALETVQAFRV